MTNTDKLAYLSGWFASDGCIYTDTRTGRHISFCLAEKDSFILDQFSSWFGGKVRHHTYERDTGPYDSVHWNCWDKDIYDWFHTHDFKNHMISGSELHKRLFIRGFFEGDGHVSFRKRNNKGQFRLTMANGAVSLLSEIMRHLNEVMCIPEKKLHLRKDRTYQLSYETRTARLLAWYLYKDATIFLPRKASVVNKLYKDNKDPISSYCGIVWDSPPMVDDRGDGIIFNIPNCKDSYVSAKMVSAGFRLLDIDAKMVPFTKGKNKTWGIFIPEKNKSHFLIYTQDTERSVKE